MCPVTAYVCKFLRHLDSWVMFIVVASQLDFCSQITRYRQNSLSLFSGTVCNSLKCHGWGSLSLRTGNENILSSCSTIGGKVETESEGAALVVNLYSRSWAWAMRQWPKMSFSCRVSVLSLRDRVRHPKRIYPVLHPYTGLTLYTNSFPLTYSVHPDLYRFQPVPVYSKLLMPVLTYLPAIPLLLLLACC